MAFAFGGIPMPAFALGCGLRRAATNHQEDLDTFIAAMGFNWLIAGTDAHAKNLSFPLTGGRVRRAPLYDMASILPYDKFDLQKIKLSMKTGDEHKLRQIGLRQWQKFAREMRIETDELIESLVTMAKQLPDKVGGARTVAREEGLKQAIIDRLATQLAIRAGECQRMLQSASV